MKLTLGALVTPNIKLIRELRRGARASVWVAHHREVGKSVAVKFIADEAAREHEAVQRFRREVEAAMQIRSPHVARIFEHGTAQDGTPYLVMELLEGETLEQRLQRQGMLTREDAGVVLRQVGSALDAAHARGIIHRDIKPSNLFLIGDHRRIAMLKVLDFGLAKAWRRPDDDPLTQVGASLGTPDYMSPEQLLGAKDTDHRTDLWALAVVTYRMVTGELPFRAPSSHALFYAICKGNFTPLTSTPAPIELEPWFKRAFDPTKDKRFGSAREMMLRFEQMSATIEDDDDVDEYESTQLINAGELLASAQAAIAKATASQGTPAATAGAVAATRTPLMVEPTVDEPALPNADPMEMPEDDMPTRQISPHEAAQAVRALTSQQRVERLPASARTMPMQAPPPPPSGRGLASGPAHASPPARTSSPQALRSNSPSMSDPAPISTPRPAATSQAPVSGHGPSSQPFGAARLEAAAFVAQPAAAPTPAPMQAMQPAPMRAAPMQAPPMHAAPAPVAPMQAAPMAVHANRAPVAPMPVHRASDTPWAGPEHRQRRKSGGGALRVFAALLFLLGGGAAYVAIKRPDLLARLRQVAGARAPVEAPVEAPPEPSASAPTIESAAPSGAPEPSATASALSEGECAITVRCEPSCEVKINGKLIGPAPIEHHLPAGNHEVTGIRTGYRTKAVRVRLKAGERETVELTLDIPRGSPAPSPRPDIPPPVAPEPLPDPP